MKHHPASAKNIKRSYGMKVALLGFDKEGRAVLDFILNDPEYHGAEIWVLDKNENVEVPPGVHARLGPDYLSNLNDFDVVFRTPGARYYFPEVQEALKQSVKISSGTKLFFERCPGKIIGVTGTKGKGTTSTLIYGILAAAEKKVFLGGNIGKPAIDMLTLTDKDSWIVLELSSFQLIDLEMSPHIGVALMVTSEHLDWHLDVAEYAAAKSSIVRFQSPDDYAVLAEDYPTSRSYAAMTPGKIFTFSRDRETRHGTWVQDDAFWFSNGEKPQRICSTNILQIPGKHNWENAGAAITVAKILGIPNAAIKKALAHFHGLEHRIEFVRQVDGVRYYNDSYCTIPEGAEVAIQAFDEPKVLILGGSSKGSDFRRLGKTISESRDIRAIVGVGVEWPRIKEHIHNPNITLIEDCTNMKEIVTAVHGVARAGDVVLLSPACASFDMFKNYGERGVLFKEAVKELKKE